MKFFGGIEGGPRNSLLDFDGDWILFPYLPQFFTPIMHLQWDSPGGSNQQKYRVLSSFADNSVFSVFR